LVLDPSFLNAVNTSILPVGDNTYDLGSSSYRWRNLELAGYGNMSSLRISGTEVIDSSRNLKNVYADASIITSGVFDVARIPGLDASKIVSGVFDVARIPDIPRSKIPDFFSAPFWGNIPDKPSTFPPSAHASTHKPGGSDALFPSDYNILPSADNTYSLGSSSYRWANVYAVNAYISSLVQVGDLTFANGWRITEDPGHGLVIINNEGKKYKLVLEEVG